MTIFSTSTKSVQREYVDKRLREINRPNAKKEQVVEAAIKERMAADGLGQTDWLDAYRRMNTSLQMAELTINFDAERWFSKPNNYSTYTQMYERGMTAGGSRVLADGTEGNRALDRAQADDIVTLPESWGTASRFTQRRRLHDALSATGSATSSKAGVDNPHHTRDFREAGATLGEDGKERKGYVLGNKHFKPRAKQIFAALNYGRRERGSNYYYGHSHLILRPSLKERALYFPGDTFFLHQSTKPGVRAQTSYLQLAALFEHALPALQKDVWAACRWNRILFDTKDAVKLIEAHLFQELKIAEDVQAVVLSRTVKRKVPLTEPEWQRIVANARDWCTRNHVRLVFASC